MASVTEFPTAWHSTLNDPDIATWGGKTPLIFYQSFANPFESHESTGLEFNMTLILNASARGTSYYSVMKLSFSGLVLVRATNIARLSLIFFRLGLG
ncbi:hypothetical protein BABINDRAFT_107119 [Babjeviella inositovora NRRL Y-12698]|uniref:Uncharacterized protein n=1 Tax=Babjeviella inositovora NRRL Y-12698 TaxID=984486 RepID=A0A1E3QWQ2_9ASCO|nr:uncharacterized protein BABINDRAFT_107119 [Babjeviella inositovora NRRL Y-12698]ODQ81427.1 hypothetical protein BABINDRAFT_107119 [Babjeviella inositovora NRRL Y-12698]